MLYYPNEYTMKFYSFERIISVEGLGSKLPNPPLLTQPTYSVSKVRQKEETMKALVIAEKPSVARDIARVLHCGQKGNSFLEGKEYVVTWALGHLVTPC